MKISTLLFILLIVEVSATTYSQTTRFTLDMRDVPIVRVLDEIESNSEFKFLYRLEQINDHRLVSLHVKDERVERILDDLFNKSQINYTVLEDNLIVLTPNKGIKQSVISGTVLSETGDPLPGVNVYIEGTTEGTVTDANGNYSIEVPNEDAVLVFSYVGYLSEKRVVTGQSQIDMTLIPDLAELDEVIVVGYGTQKKSDLTGAVSSVQSENIEDMPVLGIDQALQGNASGVQVTQNSGSPGASVMVRIRGMGTINNNDPLYVVDGMPVDAGSVNHLNPGDIESVQVLKDASATAIYGSRGANGVILISTKKGEAGTNEINFEAYYGIQNTNKEPHVMNASQFAQFSNDFLTSVGLDAPYPNPDSLGEGTNWWDEATEPAPIQNYNLSLYGGSETNTYAVSLNYFSQDGIVRNTHFDRLSMRINTDFKPLENFTFGENFSFSQTNEKDYLEGGDWGGPVTSAYLADAITEPYDSTGNWNDPLTNTNNALREVELDIPNSSFKTYKLIGNLYAEINFLQDLKFRSDFGTNITFNEEHDFMEKYFISSSDTRAENSLNRTVGKGTSWNWFNTLTYHKLIGKRHDITILAGQEAQYNKYIPTGITGNMIPGVADELQYLYAASEHGFRFGSSPQENSLLSYFGRLNYTFDNKILLTGTIRRDGSSRFGPGERWGNFPSFALAYRISEEGFMDNIGFLSDLKIRFGWGKVGNQEIGNYTWSSFFDPNENYTDGVDVFTGKAIRTAANKNVHWETQISTNFGVDFSMFNNRLYASADYFVKTTEDVLYKLRLPTILGIPEKSWQNIAEVENEGFEFNINYRNKERAFKYDVGLNFSRFVNKVTSLGTGDAEFTTPFRESPAAKIDVGAPIGAYFGYKSDGLFEDWDDVAKNASINGARPGDVKYVDIDGDNKISGDDRVFLGSPHPDFTLGFNTLFSYEFLELTSNWYAVYGNDLFYALYFYNFNGTNMYNQDLDMMDSWTPENQDTDVPRIGNNQNNVKYPSDRYLRDGSYLRLKRLQLNFILPENILNQLNVKGITLYIAAQNLFTLTKYPGMEPEIGMKGFGGNRQVDIGIDSGVYPHPRTFLGGIKFRL